MSKSTKADIVLQVVYLLIAKQKTCFKAFGNNFPWIENYVMFTNYPEQDYLLTKDLLDRILQNLFQNISSY